MVSGSAGTLKGSPHSRKGASGEGDPRPFAAAGACVRWVRVCVRVNSSHPVDDAARLVERESSRRGRAGGGCDSRSRNADEDVAAHDGLGCRPAPSVEGAGDQ
eukprot:3348857-Prymnesium_polylepis.1